MKTRPMPQSNPRSEKTATPAQNVKRLEDYAQSRPDQMSLFELLQPYQRSYSNTIELYDFIPKYVWGRVERINGEFLRRMERVFECRGQRYTVKIDPAKLEDKDGIVRDYFPSKREELVEDALRKLAAEGNSVFLDDEAAVTFSLNQLQQELKRTGHSFSKDQLKQALFVCKGTTIHIESEDKSMSLSFNMIETLGLRTQEEKNSVTNTRCFVRFNPLVTRSIQARSFRQLNYETSMEYNSVIARQLHKRLSHHYTQASVLAAPYAILLSTMIRDFGLTPYKQLRDNLRDVIAALDEMKEKDVIHDYEIDKIYEASASKPRLCDARIVLRTSMAFNREIAEANARYKNLDRPNPSKPFRQ
jgi:hypothetical protein